MKKLLQDEPSTDELVRIWTPQAFAIAARSKTPDPVGRFLEKKRIPKHEASVAAIVIWNKAQKSRIKEGLPRLIIGIGILGFGLLVVLLGLWASLVLIAIGAGFVVIGAGILWGGYMDRK